LLFNSAKPRYQQFTGSTIKAAFTKAADLKLEAPGNWLHLPETLEVQEQKRAGAPGQPIIVVPVIGNGSRRPIAC
jgi:hypothetical protein